MKIFDAHCHIYPAIIAQQTAKATERFYNGMGITLDGTVQTLFKHSGDITIHAVHSVGITPARVRSVNRFIAQKAKQFPDRLWGFGTLHPDSTLEDIAELKLLGLHGVKFHPEFQGFSLNDPRFYAICEALEGDLPVLLHTGDRRYAFSNPEQLIPFLRRFPKLTVISAHFGGHTIWKEATKALAGRFENLWVDCSSSFYGLTQEDTKNLIHAYGADRVIFGTDYPTWSPREELRTFRSLELPPEEEKAILWDNAATLLGLPE